jgi:tryptophanyl-tRNA synthetase
MRVLSGVQPTGNLHLGNYLGAIKRFVPLSQTAECYFCVVDLHAITVRQDPRDLLTNTRMVAAAYMAAGIDPHRSAIFVQSQNSHHAELGWILQCIARVGWLDRMTQFREKTGTAPDEELNAAVEKLEDFLYPERDNLLDRFMKTPIGTYQELEDSLRLIRDTLKERRTHKEKASVGLYTYPVLQAADILLYQASHVPVGDDQKQHLNLASDIAQKFNHGHQHFSHRHLDKPFTIPQPLLAETGARVMNLRDGLSKMSKSDEDDNSRINLLDDADTIARKIKKATAHTNPVPDNLVELATMPTVRNLVEIMAATRDISPQDVLDEYEGANYGTFKPALTEVLVEHLRPIREAMVSLLASPMSIDIALAAGLAKSRATSGVTMARVRESVGLL